MSIARSQDDCSITMSMTPVHLFDIFQVPHVLCNVHGRHIDGAPSNATVAPRHHGNTMPHYGAASNTESQSNLCRNAKHAPQNPSNVLQSHNGARQLAQPIAGAFPCRAQSYEHSCQNLVGWVVGDGN